MHETIHGPTATLGATGARPGAEPAPTTEAIVILGYN